MLRKVLDYLARKSDQQSTLSRPQRWFREVFGLEETWAGVEVSPENALTVSTVCACVRLLSESTASLPLHVYRRTETSKERAPDHGNYSLLHDTPNDYQTRYVWLSQAMSNVLLHGNSYAAIERNDAGEPLALWPLAPAAMSVKSAGGRIAYEYWNGGEKTTFPFENILHLKGPTLDGITGLSIIRLARQGIGLEMAQSMYGASLYKNKARPGMVIKYPGIVSPDKKREIRDFYAETFSGALNSGKTVVLEGGMELQSVGFSAEDSQYLQSRQFSVQEICRWFRVPPHLVGDPTRLAYASSETEMNAFLTHSLRPWLVNIESEINLKLFPRRTRFFAEFDTNAIARGDLAARYEAYSKGLAAGFLTVADVRSAENLPAIAGTDQLLRPANMLPQSGVNNGTSN